MKKQNFLILLVLLGVFNITMAQNYTTKSATFNISGNSTMHKWASKANRATFNGNIEVNNGEVTAIKSATVSVNIQDIKSDKNSDMMDTRTQKSLNADKHPTISYTFSNAKSITQKGNGYSAVVDGRLTINGVAKNTTMTVLITPQANGDLRITGSDKILFTNHGLKAPSFVGGTLKVDNQVDVSFNVLVKK